ncbi:hypothetical protein BJ170DRAFT_677224 [Xylariales sp. AK1849]|nr:hypothetical protein BJ170DRAFT_677224 [Xylariales sp. AK1849]
MTGHFTPYDPARCEFYAHFTHRLNRVHFEAVYWTLFITVIVILFLTSWLYQRTMRQANIGKAEFRTKLKKAMAWTSALFLVAGVIVVIEVYCLMALQFCDGEDLMGLYWSTWTMLQLGAEIAILGIVLALYHSIFDIKHPMWALALGTPVLVTAGFGHVLSISVEAVIKKLKGKRAAHKSRCASQASLPTTEKAIEPSIRSSYQGPDEIFFEIDVGSNSEVISKWPSFVEIRKNGSALIRATTKQPDDVESQAGPSNAV